MHFDAGIRQKPQDEPFSISYLGKSNLVSVAHTPPPVDEPAIKEDNTSPGIKIAKDMGNLGIIRNPINMNRNIVDANGTTKLVIQK